jgi:PAT family beta-lactamase induction signal transducer AmpG
MAVPRVGAPVTPLHAPCTDLPARLWPALLLLGFSSGLPQPLVDSTLSTWLGKAGYAPADIVLYGYVTLPFALKALWAPLVDRLVPPLGRRRGWLLGCQLVLLAGIATMARLEPRAQLGWLLCAAALVALASATQDLVVNGYTCDALPPEKLAAGAGLSVWGYRGAWLTSGGLALVAADRWGWSGAYAAMALLLLFGIAGTLLAPEPARVVAPATLRATLLEPLREWRATLGAAGLALLLLFVLLYKLPDGLANLLAVPFLAERYDLGALGLWRGAIGLAGAAAGVALAGWSVPRIGMLRALFLFGLLQALSNLGYVALERWFVGTPALVGVLFVENVCGALAATAFVAYLMSFCTSASAATQYALLSTVTLLGPHLLREPIRALVERVGWRAFFLLTTAAAAPGLALLAALRPASAPPGPLPLPKKGA